jgi:hypothetical protein
MKRIAFFLTMAFFATTTFGQVISVVAPNGTTTNVSTIQQAVDTAEVESIIYLPGNRAGFDGGVKITKKVSIVGVGYRDDLNPVTGRTLINGNITFLPGSDGSTLMGCYINGSVLIGETELGGLGYLVNNLLIQRCYITSQIKQITPNSSTYGGTGISIRENILAKGGTYTYDSPIYLRVVNPIIANNFFIYAGGITAISLTNGAEIRNNIFFHSSIGSENTNTTFINNICLGGINALSYTYAANNIICSTTTYADNYSNVGKDQIFVNWQDYSGFHYDDNYQLKSTCVGKNGGTDGTDVGIYGGTQPWKDSHYPFNPHIISSEVAPSTAADGTLNIKIKVSVDPQ